MNSDQLRIFSEIEERHWWFRARRRIFARLIEQVVPPNGSTTLLDIGCGTGGNIGFFQRKYRCIGIDAAPAAIELARPRFPGVEFICATDATELPAVVGSADAILLTDVLEHIADDFLFFSKIVALAKPNAHLLLTVPADMSLWTQHDETVLHFRRYDQARFRAIWDELPVQTKLISPLNTRLYVPIKLIRCLNRLRGRSLGRAGMDFVIPAALVNRMLTNIFEGESRTLLTQLAGGPQRGRRGVSLLALLQRLPGKSVVRARPASAAPDPNPRPLGHEVRSIRLREWNAVST